MIGKRNKKTKGQSLVELAISLPLFLMLIAGIVEVGNLLMQRQRITTAADQAARFGSRGGSNEGVMISALTTLTQTMPIDEVDLWDVFVVRGVVNADGTGWNSFSVEHVYGSKKTEFYTETQAVSITLGTAILDGLVTTARVEGGEVVELLQNQDGRAQAQNLPIVGIMMGHKVETILGIQNYFGQEVELTSQKYMTIHAVGGQTDGCDLYPIGVSLATRNLPSQESPQGLTYYEKTSNSLDPVFSIGDLAKYDYPADPPLWDEFRPRSGTRDVTTALEGDVYVLREGTEFQWARWTNNSSAANDLAWPGTTDSYDPTYDNQFSDLSPGRGFHVGDRVKYDNAAVGIWGNALQDHITVGRSIRVPIMGTDFGDHFRIEGFVILKIVGYSNDGDSDLGSNFIVAEVVRVDTSCGQVVQ